jgi:ATP-binding cassette subfamily F protein uup
MGGVGMFADYSQWETWLQQREREARAATAKVGVSSTSGANGRAPQPTSKKKLSYLEAREYDIIEQRVADAEELLQSKREQMEDSAIVTDSERLMKAQAELDEAQEKVDELYARWAELEKKKG